MIKYQPITHRADRVIVVGTGPSLVNFAAPDGVKVIAVNDAVNYIKANYWFTLDPSPDNMHIMRHQQHGVYYYAAVPHDFGTIRAVSAAMRQPAPANVHYLQRIAGDGVLSAREGVPPNNYSINTGNSAYGALQLAYHMGASKVLMIGVDGYGKYANGVGAPKGRLDHLPCLFESLALDGCEVVNGSPKSKIDCFSKMSFEEGLEWITQ